MPKPEDDIAAAIGKIAAHDAPWSTQVDREIAGKIAAADMALELLERPDTIAEGKPPVDPVVRRLREWHARDLVQLAKVATLESEVQIERAQRLRIEHRASCSDMGVADLRVDDHSDVGILDATGSPPAVTQRWCQVPHAVSPTNSRMSARPPLTVRRRDDQ